LTIDISKSPIIGSVVGVPTALLVVLLVARIAQTTSHRGSARAYQILVASSFLIFLAGLFNQVNYASRHAVETTERRDLKHVAELNGWLVEYASQHHWRSPRISFDVICSLVFPHGAIANGYEQTREFVDFQPGLGNGSEIMGVDRSHALSYLAQSEFVILTTLPKTGIYPFYEKVSTYWSDLKDWADRNLILARRILFDTFTLSVYVRPSAAVFNPSGDWITSRGVSISANRADLERFPQIRLSGPADFTHSSKVPTVSAAIETEGGSIALYSSLRVIGKRYEIFIDTSSVKDLPDPVRVSLSCDTFSVPKKLGLSGDTCELVMPSPDRVELLGKP
jgi:hypothetical protein